MTTAESKLTLQKLYWGAQDEYFSNPKMDPITLASEYLDTIKTVVEWDTKVPKDIVPREVRNLYNELLKKMVDSPFEYAEEYVAMKKEYTENGYWNLLQSTVKPRKPSKKVFIELNKEENRNMIGFTGLRFVGSPSVVETIAIEIEGQPYDKIYPSITGQFDPLPLLDAVFLNPLFHRIQICVEFCEANQPLEVFYDRVILKEVPKEYKAFYASTQFTGSEAVAKGPGSIKLNYNHPLESIRILTTAPLSNTVLVADADHKYHIPYKGMQGDKHAYEIAFNAKINFSRIYSPMIQFEASEETVLYPFAKSYNVCRVFNGMAGLQFSK